MTSFREGMCLLESRILYFDPIFHQQRKLEQFLTGLRKFRVKKALGLTLAMLTCKLPLIIVIAGPWKFDSE